MAEWTNRRGNFGKRHLWRCSKCQKAIRSPKLKREDAPKDCPNCGAKMDGEDGDKNG